MKILLKITSFAGLALSIVPPILLFVGRMEMDAMKGWMGVGMAAWMVTAPFWINKSSEQ